MPSAHHELFKQLENITCRELKSSRKLIDLVETKLALINMRSVVSEVAYDEMCDEASLFKDAVVDVLMDRYQDLSVRCFAHLCVALDYLLDPEDEIIDSDTQKGHYDDAVFLRKTRVRFKDELDRYRIWKERTGKTW